MIISQRRFACFLLALAGSLAAPVVGLGQESIWIEGEAASPTSWNQHGWYTGTDLRFDLMSPGIPGTADGALHGHWVGGDPSDTAEATWSFSATEGGTYTLWIRLNPTWAAYRLSVDGGPFAPLPTDDHRELVNIAAVIDVRWLAWVRAAELDLAPGPHSVTLEVTYDPRRDASHGAVDALCLVNYPWEPAGPLPPGARIEPPGPDVWFPLRPGDDPFSASSVTDLSGLLPRPAGIHGPLERDGNGFVFRDRRGERVKLWGVNTGAILPTESMQRRQARLLAKNGVNLVRIHPLESVLGVLQRDPGTGERFLDPAALDRFDRWFAVLKEHGIFMDWSLFYPHVVTPDDGYPAELYAELDDRGAGKSTAGLVTFMPALQDAEWEWLRRLLDHVNPHTGLRYADDPALAILETRNEDSIFWHFPLNDLAAGTRWPLHTDELQRRWMLWLQDRYGDDATLAAAWGAGMRASDSVSNPDMGVYGAWQMTADGPDLGAGVVPDERARMGDFIRFLAEIQRAGYERRRDRIRALGFEGIFVTTAWRAGGPAAEAANLWTDQAGDAIDRHSYAGGGAGGWYVAPGAVDTASHLPAPGRRLVGGHTYDAGGEEVVLYQVEGKPVILSEWSQSPPNEWKAEAAPLVAFYGMGLQGWDAVVHFAASRPRMGSGWPWNARGPSSFVTETPHYLGQLPALARAVHEGHLSEGTIVAARRLLPDEIFGGIDSLSRDLPGGGWPNQGDLDTPPEVVAAGPVTFLAEEGAASSSRLDWSALWDPTARTVTSVTGEALWDYGREVVEIRSPRTQAVIGRAGGATWSLPDVEVEVATPFMTLILTSLDGLPLDEATRILVTALARDRQWGTVYSADRQDLLEVGGPPLRLEPVRATLTFAGEPLADAQVLDIHGVPTGVAVERTGNTIVLDGRWESYLYLVTREAASGPCLHRAVATARLPMTPAAADLFLASPSPDGLSIDPTGPTAESPHLCPFGSGDLDPDPPAAPLVFWQVEGDVLLELSLDPATGAVRIDY